MKKETKQENKQIRNESTFDSIERIILKMEKLSGLCHVCASAYENQMAYSIICEDDTAMAFHNVADQIEVINQELTTLLWDNKISDQEESKEQ